MSDFSIDTPIDTEKAMASFKDNLELYLMILNSFRNLTVLSGLNQIGKCIDDKSYKQVAQHAHSLKSASAYIGAGLIHYDCFYMQEAYFQKDLNKSI